MKVQLIYCPGFNCWVRRTCRILRRSMDEQVSEPKSWKSAQHTRAVPIKCKHIRCCWGRSVINMVQVTVAGVAERAKVWFVSGNWVLNKQSD